MSNLGSLYGQGHGVPQNYLKACEWYEKAASPGHLDGNQAGCPEAGGLTADSLQNNSDSLQRNSNIAATEFQQFQVL
jgi:TPR repeat protein